MGQRPKSLDFVYVDARHDYCAVKEDILLYWPKVRPGGILVHGGVEGRCQYCWHSHLVGSVEVVCLKTRAMKTLQGNLCGFLGVIFIYF